MSDHSPPPVRYIACLSLLLLFAFPQVSHSQSAIGQLEDITGQKIQRYNVKSPNTPGMPKSPAGSMGLMLFQSLLGEALNAGADSQASAQQAAQRAELQAWMAQEQQRLTAMVAQQRVRRDQDDKASMEEMAKAMGSGFDTPMPKSDLASALSDPNVVDLRGYPADKPLFVGNLKQAIGNLVKGGGIIESVCHAPCAFNLGQCEGVVRGGQHDFIHPIDRQVGQDFRADQGNSRFRLRPYSPGGPADQGAGQHNEQNKVTRLHGVWLLSSVYIQ